MFSNKSLALKIGGGFGGVVLLLIIIAIVAFGGVKGITQAYLSYNSMAQEVEMQAEFGLNLEKMRRQVKEFILNRDDANIKEYRTIYDGMYGVLEAAEKLLVDNPERTQVVHAFMKNLRDYDEAFKQVQQHLVEVKKIYDESLAAKGRDMDLALTELMGSANVDQNEEVAYLAGMSLKYLLTGRLFVMKYQDDHLQETMVVADDKLGEVANIYASLKEKLVQRERIKINEQVYEMLQLYITDFKTAAGGIKASDDLITSSLDPIGEKMEKDLTAVRKAVDNEAKLLGEEVLSQSKSVSRIVALVALIAVIVAALAGIFISRSITVPINRVLIFANTLAQGDFTAKLEIKQNDEIGRMSTTLVTTVKELGQMIKDIVTGVGTLTSSSETLTKIATQLAENTEDATKKTKTVATSVEEMNSNMTSVSAAMEESSSNVGMVATATEEMSATIGEIAKNAERAKSISEDAVVQSHNTTQKINDLGEAASKIGRVTEAITEISEQTNLLALNATIEAARAGEAGKGFAVVANEIKELAKQTAEATVDIKRQIDEMQNTTDGTIHDIEAIAKTIEEINEVINTIATAVEQQTAATSEIAQNIAQASSGIGEVNENVSHSTVAISEITSDVEDINHTFIDINAASDNVQGKATDLAQLAAQLERLVDRFKVS